MPNAHDRLTVALFRQSDEAAYYTTTSPPCHRHSPSGAFGNERHGTSVTEGVDTDVLKCRLMHTPHQKSTLLRHGYPLFEFTLWFSRFRGRLRSAPPEVSLSSSMRRSLTHRLDVLASLMTFSSPLLKRPCLNINITFWRPSNHIRCLARMTVDRFKFRGCPGKLPHDHAARLREADLSRPHRYLAISMTKLDCAMMPIAYQLLARRRTDYPSQLFRLRLQRRVQRYPMR